MPGSMPCTTDNPVLEPLPDVRHGTVEASPPGAESDTRTPGSPTAAVPLMPRALRQTGRAWTASSAISSARTRHRGWSTDPRPGPSPPLDPLAPGHILVIPTPHYADLFETPPEVLSETMSLMQDLANAMRAALGAGGVNILSASGPGSQQSVPHLHVHVVPRWPGDGFSTWPAQRSKHQLDDDPILRLAKALTDS
ncbi:HIT family protein [Nonomuraea wenchangensis]